MLSLPHLLCYLSRSVCRKFLPEWQIADWNTSSLKFQWEVYCLSTDLDSLMSYTGLWTRMWLRMQFWFFDSCFGVAKLLQGSWWMQHKHCWSEINKVQHFVKMPERWCGSVSHLGSGHYRIIFFLSSLLKSSFMVSLIFLYKGNRFFLGSTSKVFQPLL